MKWLLQYNLLLNMNNHKLPRSKSLGSLGCKSYFKYGICCERGGRCKREYYVRSVSEPSDNNCDVADSGCSLDEHLEDSGISDRHDVISDLEGKLDKLNDLFSEQNVLISSLIEEVQEYRVTLGVTDPQDRGCKEDKSASSQHSSPAQVLLEAIETPRQNSFDGDVRSALAKFFQSEELKSRIVSSVSAQTRGAVASAAARAAAGALPAARAAHARLLPALTHALRHNFAQLEARSVSLYAAVVQATRSLRVALNHHHRRSASKDDVHKVLESELANWRRQLVEVLRRDECEWQPAPAPAPPSPAQPPDPNVSPIDRLMRCAVIQKAIRSGDAAGGVVRALCARDLWLLVAAVRALPALPALPAPALLALAQQLATDLLHDTQLKCTYLEEAIMRLDPTDPGTRQHLPLVMGEVRRHLTSFLASYPAHVASRRISLIIMAADSLLK